MIKKIIEM